MLRVRMPTSWPPNTLVRTQVGGEQAILAKNRAMLLGATAIALVDRQVETSETSDPSNPWLSQARQALTSEKIAQGFESILNGARSSRGLGIGATHYGTFASFLTSEWKADDSWTDGLDRIIHYLDREISNYQQAMWRTLQDSCPDFALVNMFAHPLAHVHENGLMDSWSDSQKALSNWLKELSRQYAIGGSHYAGQRRKIPRMRRILIAAKTGFSRPKPASSLRSCPELIGNIIDQSKEVAFLVATTEEVDEPEGPRELLVLPG